VIDVLVAVRYFAGIILKLSVPESSPDPAYDSDDLLIIVFYLHILFCILHLKGLME